MNIFNFFKSVYRKIIWVVNIVYVYVGPIYKELVAIIKEVKDTNLNDEDKRRAVFSKITLFIKDNGLKEVPDSILNCLIEIVYQIIKNKKE